MGFRLGLSVLPQALASLSHLLKAFEMSAVVRLPVQVRQAWQCRKNTSSYASWHGVALLSVCPLGQGTEQHATPHHHEQQRRGSFKLGCRESSKTLSRTSLSVSAVVKLVWGFLQISKGPPPLSLRPTSTGILIIRILPPFMPFPRFSPPLLVPKPRRPPLFWSFTAIFYPSVLVLLLFPCLALTRASSR